MRLTSSNTDFVQIIYVQLYFKNEFLMLRNSTTHFFISFVLEPCLKKEFLRLTSSKTNFFASFTLNNDYKSEFLRSLSFLPLWNNSVRNMCCCWIRCSWNSCGPLVNCCLYSQTTAVHRNIHFMQKGPVFLVQT